MSSSETVPAEPLEIADESTFEEALATYDVVLVDFYADWCGPCVMMEPTIEALASETDAAVLKVDVDRSQGLASAYGVQGIPTLLVFADGEVADRRVGVQTEADLAAAIAEYTD